VKDESPGDISAAIHYDNNYNGSIIVSGAFRNILGNNTKLFANLVLGINPRLMAMYQVGLGKKSNLGVSLDFYSFNCNTYDKDVKTNELTYTDYKVSLFYDRSFNNMYNLKAGMDYEYFRFKQEISTDSVSDVSNEFASYGTLFVSVATDTRDHVYFPTRGANAELRAEYVMPWSKKGWVNDFFTNSAIIWLRYDQNIPLSKKFVFQPGVFAGGILSGSNKPPLQHLFAFGGLNPENYVQQYSDFTGVKFLQEFGYYAALIRIKLQYNFYKKLYLTARSDLGSNQVKFDQVFKSSYIIAGYGLTAGYNSFIGPVELTIMASNLNPKPMLFLNIGFWF
jgi:NTE family protein